MSNYIRRNAVFNVHSDRDMRIWEWAKQKTGDFKKQNFAAFVRDTIEWKMNNEGKAFSEVASYEEQPQKSGWSSLI